MALSGYDVSFGGDTFLALTIPSYCFHIISADFNNSGFYIGCSVTSKRVVVFVDEGKCMVRISPICLCSIDMFSPSFFTIL